MSKTFTGQDPFVNARAMAKARKRANTPAKTGNRAGARRAKKLKATLPTFKCMEDTK